MAPGRLEKTRAAPLGEIVRLRIFCRLIGKFGRAIGAPFFDYFQLPDPEERAAHHIENLKFEQPVCNRHHPPMRDVKNGCHEIEEQAGDMDIKERQGDDRPLRLAPENGGDSCINKRVTPGDVPFGKMMVPEKRQAPCKGYDVRGRN
jgi:hypothetical protein